jgi:flagellin-like protein
MRIKELFKEDDAVSPVIGVILMVAITVILAAVIASFVLGLGDTADEVQPTSSLSFDYNENNESVTIKLADGDSITSENLWIRGVLNQTDGDSIDANWAEIGADKTQNVTNVGASSLSYQVGVNATGTGGYAIGDDEVSAGQGIELYVVNESKAGATIDSYDFDVVWDTGDDSATLDSASRDG